jgi:hypothetical protein
MFHSHDWHEANEASFAFVSSDADAHEGVELFVSFALRENDTFANLSCISTLLLAVSPSSAAYTAAPEVEQTEPAASLSTSAALPVETVAPILAPETAAQVTAMSAAQPDAPSGATAALSAEPSLAPGVTAGVANPALQSTGLRAAVGRGLTAAAHWVPSLPLPSTVFGVENERVLRGAANEARWVVHGVSRDSAFWLLIVCMVVAWYVPSSGQVIIHNSRAPIVPHFDESSSEYAFLVRAGAFQAI